MACWPSATDGEYPVGLVPLTLETCAERNKQVFNRSRNMHCLSHSSARPTELRGKTQSSRRVVLPTRLCGGADLV
jgi:hypothetical protein